ncbi:hypothetical protein [Legionella oakridgensis]|uniref:hypothetical protein n=1 Tax=Legionella oakridgensis TaxID=29423 RepID=UPI0003DE111B|nr:hypothetical protein [Legionella oakridgensis]ETO92158.1 hypothetical protein LOR_70c19740 [Legionella oakridgensis RV-2-2007]
MKHQRGFLTLTAVVIIVLFGILSATLVAMVIRASTAVIYLDAASKAASLAESGLEQGRQNLTQAALASRQTCVGLSSSLSMTTGSFSVGAANDAANAINPRYAFATLSTAIASGSTPATISVNNSAVFAPYGRVLIGREVFEYDRIANSTTLAGIARAQDGSIASTHASGTLVSQYQCTMASIGRSPASNPNGVRQYQQGIQQPVVFAAGGNGMILRWNSSTAELSWQSQSPGTYLFNAISAVNYHEGWAVANGSGGSRLSRLQGNNWTNITVSVSQAPDLFGVDAPSANEAWAVGERGASNSLTILRWVRNASNSSTNWCQLPCGGKTVSTTGISNQERYLFAVKTLDTNGDGYADIGAAVGGQSGTGSGNRGIILIYDGTQWANLELPSSVYRIGQLYGVDIIGNGNNAPKEAYFVGRSSQSSAQGKLFRLRDGVWSAVITTTAPMRSVSAVDTNGDGYADLGIAVGDNGVAYLFDGNFTVYGPFVLTGNDLKSAKVASPTDIWMVGTNGTRLHYNGTAVESVTSGVSTSNDLNGVSVISSQNTPVSSWYDMIN